jgi:hypothetical protein
MVVPLLAGAVLLVGALYAVLHAAPAHAPAHGGHTLHLTASFLRPTSRAGAWSLWALGAGVVGQLALSLALQVGWGGAPWGALAFLLAVDALGRHQDRSPLVPVALVVGLFAALFPLAFWALSGA